MRRVVEGVYRNGYRPVFLALLCLLPGCDRTPPQSSEPKVLRVMAEPWMLRKYPLREAKARFEKRHPGVTVELLKSPDGYQTRLLVSMMSRRSDMDLFFGAVESTVAMWAARDLLTPLDDYARARPCMQRQAFISSFYDRCNFGGQQYALPITAELFCFSVNKEMAARAGLLDEKGCLRPASSWEEVFDYARKMTVRDKGGAVRVVGLAIKWSWPSWPIFAALKAERGIVAEGAPPSILLDSASVYQLLTLTKAAAEEGITTLASMTDENQPRNDLKAGAVAMILSSHSRYLEAQSLLGKGSTTIMRAPGREEGVIGGISTVVIPCRSKAKALAVKFVEEEMLSPYFTQFAWEEYGKLPCLRSVFSALKAPEAHWLAAWAEKSAADPLFRDQTALDDVVKRHVQNYLAGNVALDPMLRQIRHDLALLNLHDIREHFKTYKRR